MNERKSSNIVAGVLIGGRSRRMGRDKALLHMPDGRSFTEHVVAVTREVADETVLLGTVGRLPDALACVPVLRDTVPDAGPLEGLCNLLERASTGWGLLAACDMPNLDADILRKLVRQRDEGMDGGDVDVVAFTHDEAWGSVHACCALYHSRTLQAAREELANGKGSLQRMLSGLRVRRLKPDSRERSVLANVNTAADYARLGRVNN